MLSLMFGFSSRGISLLPFCSSRVLRGGMQHFRGELDLPRLSTGILWQVSLLVRLYCKKVNMPISYHSDSGLCCRAADKHNSDTPRETGGSKRKVNTPTHDRKPSLNSPICRNCLVNSGLTSVDTSLFDTEKMRCIISNV